MEPLFVTSGPIVQGHAPPQEWISHPPSSLWMLCSTEIHFEGGLGLGGSILKAWLMGIWVLFYRETEQDNRNYRVISLISRGLEALVTSHHYLT